jgi:hypothetical protein
VSLAEKKHILHPTRSRTTAIIITLILVFVVFLTVYATQQPQTLKQWAMGKYVPCEKSLSCKGTAVEKSCLQGETKCLSDVNYYGADTVNGKSLVCCKAKRYNIISNACTLVKEGRFANPSCTN